MGNDTTTVGFNITDNGTTKKLVKDVSELDSRLKSAAKSASYMASSAAKATKAQLDNASMSSSDRLGYGYARSALGTGAEGRDFAKQAQGLGGLVRLYATFAANLFAVGAAFTALRNAADTTNMIKGLDQLGASSGKNLGGISKELVKITDGAISLREAMTATVQATSAGMSGESLKQLAAGAKNASQALGINMPDALNRLTRGITKLEPELLDELGIFVRIDDSVAKYARSLGKPISALTDLERRTAFSVDVLDQLDKKFGQIKIDSNPYDKLLASLKDIGQEALELVNKVLGPLVNYMSESPMALQAALVGAATAIVRQAIPAIGSVKEALNSSAELARKTANAKLIEAEYAIIKEKSIDALKEESKLLSTRGMLQEIAHRANLEATTREIAATAAQTASTNGLWSALKQVNAEIKKARQGGTVQLDLPQYDENGRAKLDEFGKQITAIEEVSVKKMGNIRTGWTYIRGGISAATGALSTFMAFMGPWVTVITIAITAGAALLDHFSAAKKESKAYSEAIASLNSSMENVDRVIDRIKSKSPLEQMSIESIQARATAFASLAESIESVAIKGFEKLSKMETADKIMDWFKSWFGSDTKTEMSEAFSKSLTDAIKIAEDGPAKKAAEEFTKKALNIKDLDTETLEKAFKKLPEESARKYIPQIAEAWKKAAKEAEVTAAKGTELNEVIKKSSDTFKQLSNSFIPSDNVSKVGMAMIETAGKLDLALQDPIQSLNAMQAAVKDTSSLSLFPPETASMLVGMKKEIDSTAASYAETTKELKEYSKQLQDLNSKAAELEAKKLGLGIDPESSIALADIESELSGISSTIDGLQAKSKVKIDAQVQLEAKITSMKEVFKDVVVRQMVAGAELVSSRIAAEWAKGAATATNAIASVLGKSEAAVNLRAKAEQAQLAAQKQAIQTQIDLITSNEKLATNLELLRITEEKKTLAAGDPKLKALQEREEGLVNKQGYMSSGVKQGTSKRLAEELAAGKQGAKEALEYVQKIESAMAQLNALSAQSFSIEIQRQASLLAINSENEKKSLEAKKQDIQVSLDSLNVLEAEGKILSDQQLLDKTALENAKAEYDYKIKSVDIEEQISLKRLGMVELLKRGNLSEAQSVANDIARLQNTDLITAAKQKESEISKNNAALTAKQLANQIAMRDKVLETANAYAQMAMSQKQTAVETQSILLETLNTTGKLYDSEYIQEKQILDLTKEKVALESKEIALRYEYNKVVNKLNDDLAKEQDANRKQQLKEEIALANKKLAVDLSNEQKLYDAKIDSINRIAEYELQNTALANGLADAVWTGMTEGGAAGSKAVKQALMDELKKPMNIVIKALISPITSGLQSLFSNLFMSLAGDMAAVITAGFSGILPAILALFSGGSGASKLSQIGNAFSTLSSLGSGLAKIQDWITGGANNLSILSGAKYGTAVMSQQSQMLAAQEMGMGTASAAPGSFASTLGTIGGYAAGGLAGYGLGRLIGGDYKLGGMSAKTTSGIGAVGGALLGGPLGSLIGGTIGGTLNRIFGSKTSVRDRGIEGTFGDDGFEGQQFVTKKKTGWKGIRRYTRTWDEYSAMDEGTKSALGKAFLSVRGSTSDMASEIGANAAAVDSYTKKIRVSFNGLTEEQARSKLTEELGKMQEEMASLALGTKEYSREGETALQTMQRLSGNLKGVNQVFDMLGQKTLSASLENADLAGQFADAFGGVDKMAQVSQQYFQDYYTEQERIDAQTRSLTKAFGQLGYELPSSREELRGWIDEAQEAGDPTTYAALMNLAGSFTAISEAAAAAAPKITDTFSTLFGDIASKIMELTSTGPQFLEVQRQDELSGLDPALRGLKKYQYALEDVKTAQDEVTAAQDALTAARKAEADGLKQQQQSLVSGINTLKNFVASFATFKQSLLFDSSASVLTPQQKYAQAKAQFDAVLSAATSTGTSEADKARRTEALGKLESASRTFLETSRAANASSEAYTTDFSAVQTALTAAGQSTEQQISIEQQTLDGIQTQIDLLTDVKAGILDVATATQRLADANEVLASARADVAITKAAYTTTTSDTDIRAKANEAYAALYSANGSAPLYKDLASALYSKYQIDPSAFMNAVTTEMFAALRDEGKAFAGGGLASGLAVVGEYGPEIVDFKTPGRVYTADQTAGMFAGGPMVAVVEELKALRAEVAELRKQQSTETGHLIAASFEAQQRNSEEIAQAFNETTNKAAWNDKVKQAVTLN